jgi:hypothetical protein
MKPEERYYGAQPKIAIAMGLSPRSLLRLEGILREEVDRKVGRYRHLPLLSPSLAIPFNGQST